MTRSTRAGGGGRGGGGGGGGGEEEEEEKEEEKEEEALYSCVEDEREDKTGILPKRTAASRTVSRIPSISSASPS